LTTTVVPLLQVNVVVVVVDCVQTLCAAAGAASAMNDVAAAKAETDKRFR
jgi:hypothetical protein